jgi:hypothetical protein
MPPGPGMPRCAAVPGAVGGSARGPCTGCAVRSPRTGEVPVSGYGFHWSRCPGGGAGAVIEIILIAGAAATVWMLPRLACAAAWRSARSARPARSRSAPAPRASKAVPGLRGQGGSTVHLSYAREGAEHALIGARKWIPAVPLGFVLSQMADIVGRVFRPYDLRTFPLRVPCADCGRGTTEHDDRPGADGYLLAGAVRGRSGRSGGVVAVDLSMPLRARPGLGHDEACLSPGPPDTQPRIPRLPDVHTLTTGVVRPPDLVHATQPIRDRDTRSTSGISQQRDPRHPVGTRASRSPTRSTVTLCPASWDRARTVLDDARRAGRHYLPRPETPR